MKIPNKKHLLMFTVFSVAAGLILAAARTAISLLWLEGGIEMYAHGTPLPTVLHILITVCALVVCASGFLRYSDTPEGEIPAPQSQFMLFTSMFCGFLLLAYDLYLIFEAAQNNWSALGPLIGRPQTATVTMASAIFTLCLMVFAIPAAISFFKSSQNVQTPSRPVFATMTVVWFVLFALHAYFDASISFNSPTKILRILTILALAMHAIYETRTLLGIPLPRIYFPSAYLAVLLGLTHAISDAVLLGAGKIVLAEGYLGIAVELAYVVYIIARLLHAGATVPAVIEESDTDPQI